MVACVCQHVAVTSGVFMSENPAQVNDCAHADSLERSGATILDEMFPEGSWDSSVDLASTEGGFYTGTFLIGKHFVLGFLIEPLRKGRDPKTMWVFRHNNDKMFKKNK